MQKERMMGETERITVEKEQLKNVVRAVQALLENLYEFGTVTDGEFLDAAQNSITDLKEMTND